MSGNLQILCVCTHDEIPPCGGLTSAKHRFESEPRSQCRLLVVRGGGVLSAGDTFENATIPDHAMPASGGAFAKGAPSGQGSLTNAGQTLVRVQGKLVVTRAGSFGTCCECVAERGLEEAVLKGRAILFIDGAPALTGDS